MNNSKVTFVPHLLKMRQVTEWLRCQPLIRGVVGSSPNRVTTMISLMARAFKSDLHKLRELVSQLG